MSGSGLLLYLQWFDVFPLTLKFGKLKFQIMETVLCKSGAETQLLALVRRLERVEGGTPDQTSAAVLSWVATSVQVDGTGRKQADWISCSPPVQIHGGWYYSCF